MPPKRWLLQIKVDFINIRQNFQWVRGVYLHFGFLLFWDVRDHEVVWLSKELNSSMEHSSCWEAGSWSNTQEISRIIRKPNVYLACRVHKSPPLDPILSRWNLVRTLQSHFFKTHFNTFLLSAPRSPKFSNYNSVWICHLSLPISSFMIWTV